MKKKLSKQQVDQIKKVLLDPNNQEILNNLDKHYLDIKQAYDLTDKPKQTIYSKFINFLKNKLKKNDNK